MKIELMSVALMSAIAVAAGYNMIGSNKSEANVGDLTQANVEALAQSVNANFVCAQITTNICTIVDGVGVPGVLVYADQ